MSNVTDFKVGIRYPNKNDEKYKLGYIYFPSEIKRDKYIRDELDFCRNEEKSYLSALYKNQRINAVHVLYNKRIAFAKLNKLPVEMVKS